MSVDKAAAAWHGLVMRDWMVIMPLAILPATIGQGIRLVGESGREGKPDTRDQVTRSGMTTVSRNAAPSSDDTE